MRWRSEYSVEVGKTSPREARGDGAGVFALERDEGRGDSINSEYAGLWAYLAKATCLLGLTKKKGYSRPEVNKAVSYSGW